MIFVGDDWAEAHHDVHVMNHQGQRLVSRRLVEGVKGVAVFHALVAEHATDPSEVVVGIETDRGLWVQALVAAGYQVYAINPRAVARYRERHTLSGAKSDAGDAKVLADLVRTDRHNHRPIAGDTAEVEGIKALARAHQNLIWTRTRHINQLRNTLREYYPTALEAFDDLGDRDTLAVLGRAPTPGVGGRLSKPQIIAALKRGGRQRNLNRRAEEIQQMLHKDQLTAPAPVTSAFAGITTAIVGVLVELNRQINELAAALGDRFRQHPDAAIYLSQPGLGDVLGARVLGEFGDDPNRYTNPKARRNYAGTSPVTRASGKHRGVTRRYIGNQRLRDATIRWAFCSLTASPGARAFYDEQRAKGHGHYKALRALANRLVGILHGCLDHHTAYDEHLAWGHRQPALEKIAA